jgi:hypothetical protein
MKHTPKALMTLALCMVLAVWLAACGSNGAAGPAGADGNSALTAYAGPDRYVKTGTDAALDGSGSTGGTLAYRWSITARPEGSSAALSDAAIANPTFTADLSGSYVVELIVNNGAVDSAPDAVRIRAMALPGTGQVKCYDAAGTETGCAGTGQDGEHSINPMSFTDNGDGTVTDNVTGLMWNSGDDGVTFNWYEATGTADATFNIGGATDVCGNLTLAGHSDWRLPNKTELMGIANYGTYDPAIDTAYFPGVYASFYWSSTTYASLPSSAWYAHFYDSQANVFEKFNNFNVRCVRGSSYPSSSFTENANGTVTDNVTGLIWQKEDYNTTRTWQQALDYCKGLELAGQTDWRLPDIKELSSIADDTASNPSINTNYFPNTISSNYWSSTTRASNPIYEAWNVIFNFGYVGGLNKSPFKYLVRCVR